jgi:hypothetical protein
MTLARRPRPIPAELRPAVEDLREYITPPHDEARMKRLRGRGDDITPEEQTEFARLLESVQERASNVALWLMVPHSDTIAAVHVLLLKRRWGAPYTPERDDETEQPPIPGDVRVAVDQLREYITPTCEASRVKALREGALTGRECAGLVRLLEAAQKRVTRAATWITEPSLDVVTAVQVRSLRRLARDIEEGVTRRRGMVRCVDRRW